jgi:hypothetical protein
MEPKLENGDDVVKPALQPHRNVGEKEFPTPPLLPDEEEDEALPPGILPARDLKKNLGCG